MASTTSTTTTEQQPLTADTWWDIVIGRKDGVTPLFQRCQRLLGWDDATAISVSVASTLVACGRGLTSWLLPKGTSALPMISLLTVVAATARPAFFSRIRSSGTALGIVFIQMFFATVSVVLNDHGIALR